MGGRALRDEVERLGAELKRARERLAAAEQRAREREDDRATRLAGLEAQRDALTSQLAALRLQRERQHSELESLEARLGRARRSIPGVSGHAPTLFEERDELDDEPPTLDQRERAWLDRVLQRLLELTGWSWK